MPIIKSAKKQARADIRKRKKNLLIKNYLKRAVNDFKKNPSGDGLVSAQSEIDKAAKKGLLKKNTANRRKAGLARLAKSAGVKLGTKKLVKAVDAPKPAVKKRAVKPAAKASVAKKTTAAKKPVAKSTAAKKTATAKKTTAKKA
jgi:ribosomal protein S20